MKTKYRVAILRYLALRSGNDTTRSQIVTVRADDEDSAAELVRSKYGNAPAPWRSGVQINWVKTAADWDS